jgi:asparagine synthase (glutamine-hydrolysing)
MAFYTPLTPELEQKRQQHSSQYAHIINLLQSTLIEDVSTYTESLRFESRTPVLDDRVIDFCLSVPNEVYREAGESKRLIKASMRNKIPHEVLYNSKRGLQGTNYVSKFEYESKQFNDLFRAFEKSKLISYWLDIELIKQHFQAFINPKTKSKTLLRTANFNVITRGVQLGLFLERFENGKY